MITLADIHVVTYISCEGEQKRNESTSIEEGGAEEPVKRRWMTSPNSETSTVIPPKEDPLTDLELFLYNERMPVLEHEFRLLVIPYLTRLPRPNRQVERVLLPQLVLK